MYVMGVADCAQPSNEVDIYDRALTVWFNRDPFVNARRNFPADTDGRTTFGLAGAMSRTLAPTWKSSSCPQATPSPTQQ